MTKKIWITGASSGIGRALAIKFAQEGWQVAASARRESLLEILNKNNSNIHSFPLDITNLENTKDVFQKIIKKLSEINLCVFSTGIYDPKTEREINEKQIRTVMEVNFFGTVNCIKAVEKYFKEKKKWPYLYCFFRSWVQRTTKLNFLWTIKISFEYIGGNFVLLFQKIKCSNLLSISRIY